MTRLFAGTPFDIPPRCETCDQLESQCICTEEEKAAIEKQQKIDAGRKDPGQQTARVSLQKRKGNRKVTVVEGLTAVANDLPEILTKLQATCGTGGTVKQREDLIELQGEHLDKVTKQLSQLGYKIARRK